MDEAEQSLFLENMALREALGDLLSWIPDKPRPSEWVMTAGQYGADDAINHARALHKPENDSR